MELHLDLSRGSCMYTVGDANNFQLSNSQPFVFFLHVYDSKSCKIQVHLYVLYTLRHKGNIFLFRNPVILSYRILLLRDFYLISFHFVSQSQTRWAIFLFVKSLREDFKPLNLFIIFGPSFISEISREDIRDMMKSQCYGGSIILCHTLVILCSLWQSETIKWAPKSCIFYCF